MFKTINQAPHYPNHNLRLWLLEYRREHGCSLTEAVRAAGIHVHEEKRREGDDLRPVSVWGDWPQT